MGGGKRPPGAPLTPTSPEPSPAVIAPVLPRVQVTVGLGWQVSGQAQCKRLMLSRGVIPLLVGPDPPEAALRARPVTRPRPDAGDRRELSLTLNAG